MKHTSPTPSQARRGWLDDLAQDLRYAVRGLLRHKGFAGLVVVILALGIGANTAVFSVVDGVVLRPLPFPDPDRLVRLYGDVPGSARGQAIGLQDLEEIRSQSRSFDAIAGSAVTTRYMRGVSGTERVMAVTAERGFFDVLRVGPIAGRTFRPDDPADVVVLGEAFWRRRMGGRADAIGSSIVLDGEPFTVVGVMPASFQYPYGAASLLPGVASEARSDLWTLVARPSGEQRTRGRIGGITARLKPGVSPAAAAAELQVIARRLDAEAPVVDFERTFRVEPLSDAVVASPVRRPLFVLFGAAAIVLALACANVANLLLVRLTARVREVAVRSALGAGSFRLIRQFLSESLLLALAGGAAGLGLGWIATNYVMRLARARIPRADEVSFDARVFIFLLVACAITMALFGLLPALTTARRNNSSVLRESDGRATMSRAQRGLRDTLVVAEVALAFVLTVGALVLMRELMRLRDTNSGMVTSNAITFHLGHRMSPGTDVGQFYEIAERVGQLPGVSAAGFTQMLPLQSWGWTSNSIDFTVEGSPPSTSPPFTIELRYITPAYFDALGIRMLRGRAFSNGDTRDSHPVIIINETLAGRTFGDRDPIGVEMNRGRIIGVIGDVRQVNLDRSAHPEIYFPAAQNWSQLSDLGMTLIVRTETRPEAVIDDVRAIVGQVNPNLAIFNIRSMDRVVADSLSDFTLYLSLMSGFALLALLLATVGTYGVIAYVGSARSREFAIRVALGAPTREVTRLVFRQGIRLALIGLVCGVGVVIVASPLLRSLPVNVRSPDLVTVAPVALLVGVVALAACLAPARRAARVDPMAALREEQ